MITLQLLALMRSVKLSTAERTVAGPIVAYDELIPSHGIIIHAGALTTRQPLDRVKLLRDHDMADPLGYMTAVDDSITEATFHLPEGENGDRALTEAGNGLRDGFSIGFTFSEYAFDDDLTLHVYAGEIYETSLVAIPAVASAGVSAVSASLDNARKDYLHLMNEAQLRAALSAGTITQATFDAALAALPADQRTPAEPAAPAVPAELAAGPSETPLPGTRLETRDRGFSLREAATRVATAAKRGIGAVQMALEEITYTEAKADDAAVAFVNRPDWVGEVWQADTSGRPVIDSLGGAKELTSDKIEGWKWTETPVPEKYAGDLAEVPGNGFKTEKVSFEPERWAWAARLDRKLVDLGTPDLVGALFGKLAVNYDRVSDFDVASQLVNAATLKANSPTLLAALSTTAREFRAIGASLDCIRLADDVFDQFATLKINDLPAWLALKLGVNLTDGTATVAEVGLIEADSKLAAGQFLAYDKRAAEVKEKRIPNLEAIVIPNGGLDLGFFSYGGVMFSDKRAIVKRKIVAPAS
ncbi:hypothetical protein C5D09_06360 [Rathayibacter sp. AY1C9]|uniref:HK97 family phage prohead protease n=1 Tax=Rathayibacter sp. AY1C9 TaxID=2080541 RepID=UPI000CE8878D|nr:HK97 family phage prohead protease [Rathayibacter sp. AY1C9]PPH46998.1 hypothetical protein C5D09_06360 [Rathayibacter sp. AY1C9]